jgi:uridylate kinase
MHKRILLKISGEALMGGTSSAHDANTILRIITNIINVL